MKSIRSSSKSGVFLIELIIAVAIFSVASAVCVQMFAKAHLVSRRSEDLSAAMLFAQSYAERYKSFDRDLLEEASAQDGVETYYCGYDFQGNLYMETAELPDTLYLLQVRHDSSLRPLLGAEIAVYPYSGEALPEGDDEALYSLEVKSYDRNFS